MRKVYIYKGFERFWHWTQASLIMFLAITGFEVHGSYSIFGFEKATEYHRVASWMLIGVVDFCHLLALNNGRMAAIHPHHETTKRADPVLYFGYL